MAPVIEIKNGLIAYPERTILKNINFEVSREEFVFLIGKTGSGKTSLLKTLYHDLTLSEGTAIVAGYNLSEITPQEVPFLRRRLGIVFQDFQLFTDRNVFDNLFFVLKATGWNDKTAITQRIDMMLEKVKLQDTMYKMPHQLSGGEQQRIAIARALLNDPLIVLADEPTGNLDPIVAQEILDLFIEIHQSGIPVLMATHNHVFIKRYPSRVLYCENAFVKDLDREAFVSKMEV